MLVWPKLSYTDCVKYLGVFIDNKNEPRVQIILRAIMLRIRNKIHSEISSEQYEFMKEEQKTPFLCFAC